jgi:hypothetical protein
MDLGVNFVIAKGYTGQTSKSSRYRTNLLHSNESWE